MRRLHSRYLQQFRDWRACTGRYNGRVIASLPAFDKDTARRGRRVLLEAEFSESRIAARLGSTEPGARFEDCLPQWLWRCRNGDPLSLLIRLFVLGQPVSLREAALAVSPMTVEDWEGMGLLHRARGQVSACVELTPKPGFVFASDFGFADRPPAADYVLGVTPSASLVNRCMIRRPVERGLDLGTGSGFLALHMQAHCARVMALDLNVRACAFARFNAAFNGVDGVEFRHSDRFSAVPGERFDQIVGNLPFVISPAGELSFAMAVWTDRVSLSPCCARRRSTSAKEGSPSSSDNGAIARPKWRFPGATFL